MNMYLTIAGRNLLQARRRTILLGLALSIVTALLVILLSLSAGISDTMIRSATTLMSGHVNVAGFYKATPADTGAVVIGASELKRLVQEITPGVDFIIDRQRGWGRVVSDQGSLQAGLTGIDIEQESRFAATIQLAPESAYKTGGGDAVLGDIQKLREQNSALLFASQAKRLGVEVGDALTVTTETFRGATNSIEVTVVAIAKDMGMLSNWSLFMTKRALQGLYNVTEDSTGAIQIYLTDATQAERVLGELTQKLKERYEVMEHDPNPFWMKFDNVLGEDWVGQKLDLTTWRDEVSFLTWVIAAIDGISVFLISILIVIIAFGIMNAMWMSVRERTAEVGTLRAIGMSRPRVRTMFLVEALLLALVATSTGALLGAAVASALDSARIAIPVEAVHAILMSDTLHLVVQPGQIIGAVAVFTIVAGLSALWPAYRASRLAPVTAIHHVG